MPIILGYEVYKSTAFCFNLRHDSAQAIVSRLGGNRLSHNSRIQDFSKNYMNMKERVKDREKRNWAMVHIT